MPAVGVHLKNISKDFSGRSILRDLTLDIQAGSFVSLVGPSGCGKSTLLRLIAQLDQPTSGNLELTPGSPNPSLGFVFQNANLLPWRTVLENAALPFELNPSLAKMNKDEKKYRTLEALKKVQLEQALQLFPHQLSGGMKMRVSLARALVSTPQLLLMDEPFAALDENTRFEMQYQLRELWQKEKMTVVFVTHSVSEAVFLSERIILLKADQGQPTEFCDQEISFQNPRNEELRTSEEFNHLLRNISRRIKA